MRQNQLNKEQLAQLYFSKRERLNALLNAVEERGDEDNREIQRLEHDLLLIEEKKMELGIRD